MSKRNTRDRSGAFRTTHRSQRYRGAIQKTYFDSGMTGAVFVAPDDYAGRLEEWESTLLPVWLEYGTWRAKGRPHLIPAFQAAKTRFDRLIERFVAALAQVR